MLHQIGIGTLGPVFRTYEPSRDRLVAVKAFRLDIVPEQAQALAAALGRATQASLVHPSIVEPVEAGVEGTVAYRAEEYVAAESLDVAMRHYAPAPIDRVLPFITQLAGAIDFARAAGIGHGGLHPRDIFVTPDDARATGFGVVNALEQVGIRAPIRRPYSAPERIDGRAWSTPADVFSLAAIAFELLTSKRPSGSGLQIGPLPDSDYAPALHGVLARAMDDDPSKRHASALAFASALEAAAQGRRLTDAVSVVAAIAGQPAAAAAVSPPVAAEPAPAAPAKAPEVVAPTTIAVATGTAVQPEVPPVEAPAAVAGEEFDIDATFESLDKAPDDTTPVDRHVPAARASEPSLFDDEQEFAGEAAGARGGSDDRFVFLDEPDEPRTDGRPSDHLSHDDLDRSAEALHGERVAEAAMFHATEPDGYHPDHDDRGRPALLPFAVFGVLMLLIGFAAGYFVRSRGLAPVQPTTSTASLPGTATVSPRTPPASGAATPERAGQYSEQKVTPPATATSPAPTAAQPTATHSTPAPPAVEKGHIVIRSVPSHAGVTINGTWRGRTPMTLEAVALGPYVVRVVQPGYKVAKDEFVLSAREPSRTFTARLELAGPAASETPAAAPGPAAPAATKGSLYVDSRPRGAAVTIDGRNVGQTPLTVPELAAGAHVVRIELEGKKTVTANPRVVAGQMERVTVSLEDR